MIVVYYTNLFRKSLIDELDGVLILYRGYGLTDANHRAIAKLGDFQLFEMVESYKRKYQAQEQDMELV
jgi:hypothetical protein